MTRAPLLSRLLLLLTLLLVPMAPDDARAEALEVLIEEQARTHYGASFPDAGVFDITVQGDLTEAVVIPDYWMDPRTGQFIANIVTESGELRRISGLALLTVPVPVPLRRMMPDEIVAREDLQVLHLPHARVHAFAVTALEDVVGMQVRRLLAQGRPIMQQSVMQPRIIDRGDRVAIHYRDGPLKLVAPGRALGDAHRGQEVKIVNLTSNTSIVATAAAEGIVEVLR
jgi:flagella basal body P-ring formation protein FlgA